MYIQATISKTSKGYHPKDERQCYDKQTICFPDLKTVKAWLKEEYAGHTKSPMYIDKKNGTSIKVGWIIGFKNEQYNNETGKHEKFTEQHWIHLETVEDVVL